MSRKIVANVEAPHGWVRVGTYGATWHRATCAGTAACGASMRGRGDVERADFPPPAKHAANNTVCVTCFRAAVGVDCSCSCARCTCSHGKAAPIPQEGEASDE